MVFLEENIRLQLSIGFIFCLNITELILADPWFPILRLVYIDQQAPEANNKIVVLVLDFGVWKLNMTVTTITF